jgi:hypothetical protein
MCLDRRRSHGAGVWQRHAHDQAVDALADDGSDRGQGLRRGFADRVSRCRQEACVHRTPTTEASDPADHHDRIDFVFWTIGPSRAQVSF